MEACDNMPPMGIIRSQILSCYWVAIATLLSSILGSVVLAEEAAVKDLPDLQRSLEKEYPSRAHVEDRFREIAARLVTFANGEEARGESAGGSKESGQARLLAAEVLLVGGDATRATQLLQEVVEKGPADDDKAKALYMLGEREFFRERFVSPPAGQEGGPRTSAAQYWIPLSERFPSSPWARCAERPLRYLKVLQGAPFPSFREKFRDQTTEREYTLEGLRGKVVAIDFWKSSSPGQLDFEEKLSRDLKATMEKFRDLEGKVEVLGVNLDARVEEFERAAQACRIFWPQHHDGLGFETPLAVLLGIPREPQMVVLDPEGRLVYMGGDSDRFFRLFSKELKRVRGVED